MFSIRALFALVAVVALALWTAQYSGVFYSVLFCLAIPTGRCWIAVLRREPYIADLGMIWGAIAVAIMLAVHWTVVAIAYHANMNLATIVFMACMFGILTALGATVGLIIGYVIDGKGGNSRHRP